MKFRVDARFDDQTIELYAKMMVYMDFKFDKKYIFLYNLYILESFPWRATRRTPAQRQGHLAC